MIELIKQTRLSILIIILAAMTWILMIPSLPYYIGMQYTLDGEVIWETNKYLAAFIVIGIMIAIYILSIVKPILDPAKASYTIFKKYFVVSILLAELLVFFSSCMLILASLDSGLDMSKIVMLIVGLILIFVGNYLPKVPTTWFVGIRNPWTLSDKNVWNRTHRFTGIVYILSGFVFIFGALLNFINLFIVIMTIVICLVIPHVYSYFLYKQA